tara:strand:- start:1303 stop:1524 length:222 start_codon:yes stop_codon:yes gene_type:complete
MDIDILYKTKELLEEHIKETKNYLFYKEELLKKCIKKIQENCNHIIVTDSIDLLEGYKEGVIIKYCENCEKTF